MFATIAQGATKLVLSAGAATVAGYAIKAVTPENLNLYGKIMVGAGSIGLGLVVGSQVDAAAQEYFDTLRSTFSKKNKVTKED